MAETQDAGTKCLLFGFLLQYHRNKTHTNKAAKFRFQDPSQKQLFPLREYHVIM